MLKDRFDRVHDYLRISLTDKCNLRCAYCNPVSLPKGHFSGHLKMSAAEIDQIVSVFTKQGVKKIRLTGGEPLVRKDAKEIIQRLSKYPVDLGITTNGVFLHEYLETFKNAGLDKINVSLDSLNRNTYFNITGRDEFDRVLNNINLLLDNNFMVKVNVVVIKNVNHQDIPEFIEWTKDRPLQVRFIEFMPFSGNHWTHEKVFTFQEMLELISSRYSFVSLPNDRNDTAKKFSIPAHQGTFAVISSISHPFCRGCNRMRLTTDGKMKNCLFSKGEVDLLGALRNGQELTPLIKECLSGKEKELGGRIFGISESTEVSKNTNRSMIHIGG